MNRLSWIFIGVSAVLVILISFFFLKPRITSAWQTYQNIKSAKQQLTDAAKEKEILSQLSQNDKLASVHDIAEGYIPESQDSGDLVIELTALAGQNNLQVSQFSLDSGASASSSSSNSSSANTSNDDTTPTSSTSSGSSSSTSSTSSGSSSASTQSSSNATEVKFSVSISGAFTDFENFLKGVETGNRLISISSINLSTDQTGMKAQLLGKAYWKKSSSLTSNLSNITISQKTIDKFLSLKTYGTPINLPTESGFGRTDPFANY